MTFREQLASRIVASAMTLYERVGSSSGLDHGDDTSEIARKRLARWRKNAADDDPDKFARRLGWDGLDERTAIRLLGSMEAPLSPEPEWVATLEDCLDAVAVACAKRRQSPNDNESLDDYFLPICRAVAERARQGFEQSVEERYALLPHTAWSDLTNGLHLRLWSLLRPVLDAEFRLFVHSRQSSLTVHFRNVAGLVEYDLREFFHQLSQDGMVCFFEDYAFLARLAAVMVREWQEATDEFVTRLWEDRHLLQAFIGSEAPLPAVQRIQGGISDFHHGSRSVLVLTFCDGRKVVYKPKDMCMERGFSDLLRWLDAACLEPRLKSLQVMERQGYGWVEYVNHAECSDEDEGRLYFVRCGMLLALCYLLDGTDIHHENVVACGADPVIVDLETIFHPQYPEDESLIGAAQRAAGRRVWKSVLRTMMLPNWMADHDGHRFNVGGMGAQEANDTRSANVPRLKGRLLSTEDYREDVEEGFRKLTGFFIENKHVLCGTSSPLNVFRGTPVRFVLRPTRVYNQLMRRILHPAFLREGIDASIEIDTLALTYVHRLKRPTDWSVLYAEHNRLLTLNTPYFQTRTDCRNLVLDGGGILRNYFRSTAFDEVIKNIASLTPGEIEEQLQFIRASFHTFRALPAFVNERIEIVCNTADAEGGEYSTSSHNSPTRGRFLEEAERIADTIMRTRIVATDGTSTWIGMQFIPALNRYEFQVVDHGLYAGNSGCALFLACVARETGKGTYADACRSAMEAIRARIRQDPSRYTGVLGLGGFNGMASVAYALLKSGNLLGDKAMVADAERALNSIAPALVGADRQIDVMLGTAGALLVLLDGARGGDERMMGLARMCGDHLLATLPNESSGDAIWHMYPRTGISHGCAGVAMALVRLAAASGERHYLEGARCLVEFENGFWNEEFGNWIDGDGERTFYGMAWCHGSPGIVLARLNCLAVTNDALWHVNVDRALEEITKLSLSPVDNLCCGTLGRCLVLLEAAKVTHRQEWHSAAWTLALGVLDKVKSQRGAYNLVSDMPPVVSNPSLMQGLAGVGFGFLTLAGMRDSTRLPDVLTLQ
ncbi:MAG: type 2 lanthipeptide synthetase LanM family protein [bacterium]